MTTPEGSTACEGHQGHQTPGQDPQPTGRICTFPFLSTAQLPSDIKMRKIPADRQTAVTLLSLWRKTLQAPPAYSTRSLLSPSHAVISSRYNFQSFEN